MPRPARCIPLPPVTPIPLGLISLPLPGPPTRRSHPLRLSPAHTLSMILAEAHPRFPVSYSAISPIPRELSLALKLATAPREPGPLHLFRSNRHLIPTPKSPTLSRCPPLSFAKGCPCPISRRCGNWRPSPPMPKFYSPPFPVSRILPELPRERYYKVMNPPPRPVIPPISLLSSHHALKKRPRAVVSSRSA